MVVRLTKKLADLVNGLDISHCVEGDVIDLPVRHAQMLINEGWAEEAGESTPTCAPEWRTSAATVAADRPMRRRAAHESDDEELISRLRQGINASWGKGDPDSAA